MAASSDQPVSVGNLAAVLEGGALGGFQLLYDGPTSTEADVAGFKYELGRQVADFDLLVVLKYNYSATNRYLNRVFSFIVPVFDGLTTNSSFEYGHNMESQLFSVGASGTTFYDGIYADYLAHTRIYGIRAGGGQLLAKLLRDLCGEVA